MSTSEVSLELQVDTVVQNQFLSLGSDKLNKIELIDF